MERMIQLGMEARAGLAAEVVTLATVNLIMAVSAAVALGVAAAIGARWVQGHMENAAAPFVVGGSVMGATGVLICITLAVEFIGQIVAPNLSLLELITGA